MTTNRMGLEQALSDEAAAAVATLNHLGYTWQGGKQWKPPVGLPPSYINDDRAELEAYRKAAGEPVAWESTTTCYVKYVTDKRYQGFSDQVKQWYKPYKCSNCAATQPQAVTVPDEMTPEMMRAVQLNSELGAYAASNLCGAYDLFAEFWKVACRAAMLKSVTNEP